MMGGTHEDCVSALDTTTGVTSSGGEGALDRAFLPSRRDLPLFVGGFVGRLTGGGRGRRLGLEGGWLCPGIARAAREGHEIWE